MANERGRGCEDEAEDSSSGSPSPKNRVKFMCSLGGKIMPRPVDGQLKYIGGETRVIAVPRDITFSELMKKLGAEFEGGMILKYQVMPEELDILVSVKTNEDLKHMFDEYSRHEIGGTPKLRVFLFPSNPVPIENHTSHSDPLTMEQRYIDAVNGSSRQSVSSLPLNNPKGTMFSVSACTSPRSTSPESNNGNFAHHEASFTNACNRVQMHKVHSTPNLCSLSTSPRQSSTYHLYQYHDRHYQQQHRSPHDHHKPAPALSSVRHGMGRSPAGPGINQWYTSRHKMGSGNSNKYAYCDEYPVFVCRASDRSDDVPQPWEQNSRVEQRTICYLFDPMISYRLNHVCHLMHVLTCIHFVLVC